MIFGHTKKISAIIPVYNVENYLEECLNSIRKQTFKDIEVICIDDGSTDGSLEILYKFASMDSRFVVYSMNHSGVGAARNKGLDCASGEYVQFLDADDYFEPFMFEQMYDRAQDTNADIVVCSAKRMQSKNIEMEKSKYWPVNLELAPIDIPFCWRDYPDNIFTLFAPEPWSSLYKKELLIKNNLRFSDLASSNGATLGLLARILANRILILDREFINYRYQREGSITKRLGLKFINAVIARKALYDYLIHHGLYHLLQDAFMRAMTQTIQWIASIANNEDYEWFIAKFKEIMGDEWVLFKVDLYKRNIKLEHIESFVGNKKVMCWGASNFLKRILDEGCEKDSNILGIIDKNIKMHGKMFSDKKIFAPESLFEIKPDAILCTVANNSMSAYMDIKKYLEVNHPQIELLPNIFEYFSVTRR